MVTPPVISAVIVSMAMVLLGSRDGEWQDRCLFAADHSDSSRNKESEEGRERESGCEWIKGPITESF